MLNVKQFAILFVFIVAASAGSAHAQSLPKVRAAYTSIGIQFDPIYIMKELDLARKYGLDVEMLAGGTGSFGRRVAVYHQRRGRQHQCEHGRR
jgi:hypothetical protein